MDINAFLKVVEKFDYNSPSFEHTEITQKFIDTAKKLLDVRNLCYFNVMLIIVV